MIASPEKQSKKTFWDHPWGYPESFIIAGELLVLGFIIEFLSGGQGLAPITMPWNFYILAVFSGVLIALRIFYFQNPIVKWLSSVPAAISSIIAIGLIALLMGIIPQSETTGSRFVDLIGLTHLKHGWPIILAQLLLLSTLGIACLKRITLFKGKNIGFLLNHFGLWITLVAAMMGSGDLKRLSINLLEDGKSNNFAIGPNNEVYKLPFELKLLDFEIEQYSPKLVLFNSKTNDLIQKKGEKENIVEPGKTFTLQHWDVTIDKFHHDAIPQDSGAFLEGEVNGSYPVAFVTIKNRKNGQLSKGWLGTGSFAYNPSFIFLQEDTFLAMTLPEPKKYSSMVVLSENNVVKDTVTIAVNKPYSINGWKLYQLSYDENKGKWSTLSVLEVVSDPWLKIVYAGIFLMLGGSVFLFWTGRKRLN